MRVYYDSPGSDLRSDASLNGEYVTIKNATRAAYDGLLQPAPDGTGLKPGRINGDMTADTFTDSTNFLTAHSAAEIPHPGGTLLEHLQRVAAQLKDWDASHEVQLAGLCHATYGTDGFDRRLLDLAGRDTLRDLIGERAEALVYLYASCDREATYLDLRAFRDRFTGAPVDPTPDELQAFLLITAANEIDVARHNADILAKHGNDLFAFFSRHRNLLLPMAWETVKETFAVRIARLDHLVLTVTDIPQTIAFYQKALGMEQVTFGDGRHALTLGSAKINLHQAGLEIRPHALHPIPGSADLCLITAGPLDRVAAHLAAVDVPIEEGPVSRTGALGPITSLYIRDPDHNLIEIAAYD
ncbi:VOC family protein [Streptosporangium sp. CA-135522]|uniref:VOC family protein n=1 Tax=Streptosporangium sp. CA-135522 TaxID=3240072 RepID=UPI003D8AEF06